MRWVVGFVGWVVLVLSLALTLARYWATDRTLPAMAASFGSYAVVGFVVAFLLLLPLARRKARARPWLFAGATLALLGVGLQAWVIAPLYVGEREGQSRDLTVMTANLFFGRGDADTVVRTAVDRKVDLLVLQEVTPGERERLRSAGLDQLLPNVAGDPQPGVRGTMVFSRFTLTADQQPLDLGNGGVAVRVGAPRPFRLLAVHTATPTGDTRRWARDLRTLRTRVRFSPGPLVVAGDFNATTDHALFRQVLGGRLSDAPAVANSGWQTTWPTSVRRTWYHPVIAIDHVLTTPRFSAVLTRTAGVPGSDHRALLVDLDVNG